jgi:DNA adenine methylase
LTDLLRETIYANKVQGCTYVEPFAGGSGAGLRLLADGHVDRIVINDKDQAVFSMWNAVMKRPDEFTEMIKEVPLTIDEWRRQRLIYENPRNKSQLELGFATFFLNRCNRSGIIMNGGPIGGMSQAGKWKLDARFNRKELGSRIENLASYGDRIIVSRRDAVDLLGNIENYVGDERIFVYADPPYYVKGKKLYLSYFEDADHKKLALLMSSKSDFPWIMTYDDVPRIRELYSSQTVVPFRLRYSAHSSSLEGGEVLIAPNRVTLPKRLDRLLLGKARNAGRH